MNILVIESSPHKHGSSNLLAEEFIRGAKGPAMRSRCLTPVMPVCIPASAAMPAGCPASVCRRTIWPGCGRNC